MEYRILGKTGLKVSRLGVGGIPIQRVDAPAARALLQEVSASGVNFIDSARGYTVSEEYFGYALEGLREKFILATKSMSRDKAAMAQDIATSLKNFRTDYIDLYQLHNVPLEDFPKILAPGGALEALQEAKAAGKIRHIGITVHTYAAFQAALEQDWVETIMFPYNIVELQGEDLIARCKARNVGFINMKPLAGGALEDATLALRFLGSRENIDLIIPGMANLREFRQNLAALEDSRPLSREELSKMEEIRSALGTDFCRRCNYCAPCTVGIGIPSILTLDGYYSRYGLKEWAESRYAGLSVKASDCIGCGVCESRCPYQLPIREKLKQVAAHFE